MPTQSCYTARFVLPDLFPEYKAHNVPYFSLHFTSRTPTLTTHTDKMDSSSSPHRKRLSSSLQAHPGTPPSSPPVARHVSPIAFKIQSKPLPGTETADAKACAEPLCLCPLCWGDSSDGDSEGTETASNVTLDDPDRPCYPYEHSPIIANRGISPGAEYFRIAGEEISQHACFPLPCP